MNQKRYNGKLSIIAAGIQLIFCVVLYVISYHIEPAISAHFMVQAANLLFISALISFTSFIHSYMQSLADEEVEELKKSDKSGTLFENEADGLSGRYKNSNAQFNKVILPVIVILISIIEFALTYSVISLELNHSHTILPENLNPLLISASVFISFSCCLFIFGKYCMGIAEESNNIYIIPIGSYMIFCSFLCLVSGIASLLHFWQFDSFTRSAMWLMCGLSIIIAVERLIIFIIEKYRPQTPDTITLSLYNSRLLRLISQPRRIVANLAEVIEYQFGVNISEQWLQNFCSRIFIPCLFIQIISFSLLTCFTYVNPGETALKEYIGSTQIKELSAGLYINYPWPINRIHRIPTKKIFNTSTGTAQTEKFQTNSDEISTPVLWNNDAFNNNVFLVGSNKSQIQRANQTFRILDVNLVSASINVHYKINNPLTYFTIHNDNDELLKLLSRQVLNRHIINHDFYELIRNTFTDFSKHLKKDIQSISNTHQLGCDIIHVDVSYIQPPPAVAKSFQQLISAQQSKISNQIQAQKYAIQTMAEADSAVNQIVKQAESDTVLTTSLAEVEKNNYLKQQKIYNKYPELYKTRLTMDTLEYWLQDVRKIVINFKSTKEVINLELKKSTPDILDISAD